MGVDQGDELSVREIEILRLVATGATNHQVARALHISPNTVKTHLRNIFVKLDVSSRTEATLYAVQHGLVDVATVQEPRIEETPADTSIAPDPLIELFQVASARPLALRARMLTLMAVGVIVALMLLWPTASARVGGAPSPDRLTDAPRNGSAPSEATRRWTQHAPMISSAGRFALATMDDLIYVIGGVAPSGVTGAVQIYSAREDAWRSGPPKPTPASNIGAATIDGLIYVPGGLDAAGDTMDELEILDPATDTWHTGPQLPVPLCSYAIAADEKGLFLFGGWDGERYTDAVYYLDTAEGQWQRVASLSQSRGFAAAAQVNGRILLLGGYDGEKELDSCESFDPALARAGEQPWQPLAPMPEGRAGHAAASTMGHVYVLGGGWQSPLRQNLRYDIANDSWTVIPSPITGEWRTLGAAAVDAGQGVYIYAFGGWHDAYIDDVWAYQAFYRLFLP